MFASVAELAQTARIAKGKYLICTTSSAHMQAAELGDFTVYSVFHRQ